ncbi:MAG: sodium:solute symporter [Gammaproteobacteria bacterium]|nr:sodium:solute symporter [Gammaproteobacteria bacterium]MBU1556690.1 sodium:solute symporter [Gammaproteobacteria bacterium]MBU2070760.1 sodium:solute symporter [Gammaproteobacteria bacterium]MBU2182751.1 sodium:solute symporter [Gammaproteobacteria bacterium]MBU2206007.1 sodium:solute symporter [Gammaproteobacteria bacterium]
MQLTLLDWIVFFGYFAILAAVGWAVNRRRAGNSQDYFLAANTMPVWVVAISVLATSQSAATFLGGPDMGFRGNLSYLASNIGALIAAVLVMKLLLPRYYQLKVTTVYELLERRFGASAKDHAGKMYLFGRLFASGARLYMAAIAVAMLLFNNIAASSVLIAVGLLAVIGLLCTVMGGIRSVIYTDALQCAVYVSAAMLVLGYLYYSLGLDWHTIYAALDTPTEGGASKWLLFDWSLDFSSAGVFNMYSALTGFVLLNIAAFGMDQDMTQRVLTCKDSKAGARALLSSVLLVIPTMLVFILIGFLLYIFYQRPDLYQPVQGFADSFAGEKVTVFMYYVLNEMPSGLRGLVVVGVIAAALSTITSGLNSMASVLVADIYQPWRLQRKPDTAPGHFVRAGQLAMLLTATALALMAILCFYWQQYSAMPLLAFALSVMVFSYSGLLGVFFTALFSHRGNRRSVTAALLSGFAVTLALQPYVVQFWSPALAALDLGFTWQLCLGTLVSSLVCLAGTAQPDAASKE